MAKRVLKFVDDDEDIRDLLRQALETRSYEVTVAQDGPECPKDRLQTGRDIIFC